MDNLVVVVGIRLSKKQLRNLVESWGGQWNDEPTLNQGVIERDSSVIYVSLGDQIERDYEADEIEDLTAWLGSRPKAYIDVHISHRRGSQELANEFAQAAISKWQGVFDDGRDGHDSPTR